MGRLDTLAGLDALEKSAGAEVLERDIEIRCFIDALLGRLNMAVVGPPGSGKSYMVDVMAALIDGFGPEDYFRSQVGRRTEPDDLLGSYTLESLRAGRRRRDTTRKLPNARLAAISEFWRAPDSATDDLRSILQEHVFYNGGDAQPTQLCTLVVESNEMPEASHALADRFTFWLVVRHLVSPANRKIMLARAAERLAAVGNTYQPVVAPVIAWADIEAAQREVAAITVGEQVRDALGDLWTGLHREAIYPSDRRLNACLGVMQAEAYRAGRDEVTTDDMALLPHVLRWAKPDQMPKLQRLVYAISSPHDLLALDLSDRIDKLAGDYKRALAEPDVSARKRRLIATHMDVAGDRRTGRNGVTQDLVALRDTAESEGRQLSLYPALASRARGLARQLAATLEAIEAGG